MVDGGGETPGPIPNPEAKPARADGTAPGREWESRLPPTQQLHTQTPAVSTTLTAGAFSYTQPVAHETHLGGAHQPIPRPGRYHPARRNRSRGRRGRRASTRSNDDASCSAEVEYRTSSTPACTDGLDLHHSTNNAPTTTRDRAGLRIADNPSYTHHWRPPTNSSRD